ncbi:MAG: ribosome silencing factor [bacterium]|nr:ribosome silencing factor [bacterium]
MVQQNSRPINTTESRMKLTIQALQEKKVMDCRVIHVSDVMVGVTDYFIICSGLNAVHLRAVAAHVKKTLAGHGVHPLHEEGGRGSRWILADYGDFVLHLFLEELRNYYDIEGLWSDAPSVPLEEFVTSV